MSEHSPSQCPCCGGSRFERLLDFGRVPVSGQFRENPSEPPASADLRFELCGNCGLVRQHANAASRDYSAIDRTTARQFPSYGNELIAKLRSLGVGPDDLVLDIGSNDGSFLEAMRAAGFKHLIGVEPSRRLAEQGRARGFPIENDYFGPGIVERLTATYGHPRAAVCRHTLEHVPDPLAFVKALRDCLDPERGVALLEVPDGSAIPELMNVYEFWDEHLFCFCAENLMRLVEKTGLVVLGVEVQPHLDTRNLLLWCGMRPATRARPQSVANRDCVAMWRELAPAWGRFRERLGGALRGAPGPLYLIGGSHSQYNFVNYAGLGAFVGHFIDDDSAKVGRCPPVAGGVPTIISTAQFERSATAGTVLKTGFGYPKWSARICASAEAKGMCVLDLHPFLEQRA